MSRTVEVQLEVDSSGAIQKVESAGASFERLGQESDEAASQLDEAAQASRSSANASEQAAQASREQAAAQERVSSTTTTMSSNVSSSANALGFELVQASQDAKFGLMGVANQIPLMTEQFSQLQEKTGSTSGAMGALFSALKGPAGVIGAFTLLLTFKDEIVGFFESVGGQAETAAAGIEQVKGQLEETLDLGDLGELGTDTEAIREEIDRLEEGLGQLKSERERLANESETAVERAALSAQSALGEFLRSQGMSADMVERLGAAEGEAAERANDAATRQDELDAAINQVNTRLRVLRGRLRAIDAVGEVAPELLSDEGASGAEDNLDSVNQLLQETIRSMSQLPDGQLISQEMPDLQQEMNLPALATDLQDIQLLMEVGMLNSVQSVDEALGSLDQMFRQATSQEKRERIRALQRRLEAMRGEMQGVSQEGVRFGKMLSQGIANAITQAATAIGEGTSALEAVGQVLGQLFQRLGSAMIAYGIGLEAVKQLNPAVAIAGGAALVAAGAALSTALSDTQNEIGSTDGDGVRRDRISSGGEASSGIDVPGRASGGPIRAGRPYMVGERGPEMIVPNESGVVVSNQALNAATSRPTQNVSANVNSQVAVEDVQVDADIFKLRARLNEVENDISELR